MRKWTVLTYIAAHNNLSEWGKKSLVEIRSVGSTSDVLHGVFYDGALKGHDFHAGVAARYVMGDPGKVLKQERLSGQFDCGDPKQLIAAAEWLYKQFPAERYGVVLWSHGSGWAPAEIEKIAKEARPSGKHTTKEFVERSEQPGSMALFRTTVRALLKPETAAERAILFDDGTGHSVDTLELAGVMRSIANAIGQPVDFLGMDACLMATIEVAYELRDAVRFLVASEELVPAESWPYQDIYGRLRANPRIDGAGLARLAVERYVSFYEQHSPGAGDVTLVAVDLGKIKTVADDLDVLSATMMSDMTAAAPKLRTAQISVRKREEEPRQPKHSGARQKRSTKFDYHLWDVRSLASELSKSSTLKVNEAAHGLLAHLSPGVSAVLSEGHVGSWFDGIGGLTAYLVPEPFTVSEHYANLALAKDTKWGKLVSAYRQYFA